MIYSALLHADKRINDLTFVCHTCYAKETNGRKPAANTDKIPFKGLLPANFKSVICLQSTQILWYCQGVIADKKMINFMEDFKCLKLEQDLPQAQLVIYILVQLQGCIVCLFYAEIHQGQYIAKN